LLLLGAASRWGCVGRVNRLPARQEKRQHLEAGESPPSGEKESPKKAV